MTAEREPRRKHEMAVKLDRPLLGAALVEDGQEITRYFSEAPDAEEVIAESTTSVDDARALDGAWSDLDWDEMIDELDRIRHESQPTPSIDER